MTLLSWQEKAGRFCLLASFLPVNVALVTGRGPRPGSGEVGGASGSTELAPKLMGSWESIPWEARPVGPEMGQGIRLSWVLDLEP